MGRLRPEALYANELVDEHLLRSRRQVDVEYGSEGGTDVEDLEGCWERAAQRVQRIDPDGSVSLALLEQVIARSK